MKSPIKRAIALTFPVALIVGSTIAVQANVRPMFRPTTFRVAATGATVLGGGATLPVPAYLGLSEPGPKYESSGQTSFGVTGSVFGYFATVTSGLNVEYCATGSGKGKTVFEGAANTVDNPCANAGTSTPPYGFLPPSKSPTQTYPTLAGTDAPLAESDYTAYISGHPTSSQEPVQLPSLFGSIAIFYNDPTLPSGTSHLTLTDAQICGVYTGSITKFSQLTGNSADKTAIVPIYRSDGSGTSFNFSNHLATVCGSPFNGNQQFSPNADPSLPAGSLGENGNGGVITGVEGTTGGFGYVEAGYLNEVALSHTLDYADVTNKNNGVTYDPIAGLPLAAYKVTASLVANEQVIQGTGPATVAALSGSRTPDDCVEVLPPSGYANVPAGYPIVAVTYLLFNNSGNGTAGKAGLVALENILATPSNFKGAAGAKITTVDEASTGTTAGTTGYSSLNSTYGATLKSKASSCIGV